MVRLTDAEIASLLSLDDAMEAAREAFVALARGQATMPQRLAVRVPEHQGTHLSMPCYVRTETREILCTKLATVFERNSARGLPTTMATLILQDPETGELLALMDGEAITRMRTAAASALASDLMAPRDARTMTVFGAGGQAEAHIRALLHIRPRERIYVVTRTAARGEDLARQFAQLVPTEDLERAVRESQIIVTATNSQEPVFEGAWLRDDACVVAVGAFRPDMREVDAETVRRCSVVVDRIEAARNGAGDLIQANVDWSKVVELGSLLVGETPVPSKGPWLFKSVGLAVQDATMAARVYDLAIARTARGSRSEVPPSR